MQKSNLLVFGMTIDLASPDRANDSNGHRSLMAISHCRGKARSSHSTRFQSEVHQLPRQKPQTEGLSDQDLNENESPSEASKSKSRIMTLSKKNPQIMNRFIATLGAQLDVGDGSAAGENFFSQRENLGRIKTSQALPNVRRLKTAERENTISFDVLSPRPQNLNLPNQPKNAVTLERRYTAQRSRRMATQMLSFQESTQAVTHREKSNQPPSSHKRGMSSHRATSNCGPVSQRASHSINHRDHIQAVDTKQVGVFADKPGVPNIRDFETQRGTSAGNFNSHRQRIAELTKSLQQTSTVTSDECAYTWDERRARNKNIVFESFSGKDPCYRRLENIQVDAKQRLPLSHVKVPEYLKNQLTSRTGLSSFGNSVELHQNKLLSSRVHSPNVENALVTERKEIVSGHRSKSTKEDAVVIESPRSFAVNKPGQPWPQDTIVSVQTSSFQPQIERLAVKLETMTSSDAASITKEDRFDLRNSSGSVNITRRDVSPRLRKSSSHLTIQELLQKGSKSSYKQLSRQSNQAVTEISENPGSSQRSLKDTASLCIDSKISSNGKQEKAKRVNREEHELASRAGGQYLPLSVDRQPKNKLQRAVHKLARNHDFEKVAQISLRQVNEELFVSQLHNVKIEEMDAILRQSKLTTEDTSKLSSDQGVASNRQAKTSTDGAVPPQTKQLSTNGSELASTNEQQPLLTYVPLKLQVTVKNPLFRLEQRPAICDVMFRDIIHSYEANKHIDIYSYKSEDYLDDIRKLRPEESLSLDVRVAHDLMSLWQHYIKPPPPPQKKKKTQKVYRQASAYESKISVADNAFGHSNLSSTTLMRPSRKDTMSKAHKSVLKSSETSIMQVSQKSVEDSQYRIELLSAGFASLVRQTTKTGGQIKSLLESLETVRSGYRKQTQCQPQQCISKHSSPAGQPKSQYEYRNNRETLSASTLTDDDMQAKVNDIVEKRVILQLYEAASLCQVTAKLNVDFEAILKLQRKVSAYSDRRIMNVLPLYIFDDFQTECNLIQREIVRRRTAQIEPLVCTVTMKDDMDKRVSETGQILDYWGRDQMFIVEVNEKRYYMHRLCIQIEEIESKQDVEDRRVAAMQLGKNVLLRLNIERILFEEIFKLRPELRQPAHMTNAIEKLLDLGRLKKFSKRGISEGDLRELVQQFESLFCFSMAKSILMSEAEQDDPKVSCMLTGYSVERNKKLRTPYYGLRAYEKVGKPIDHLIAKKDCQEFLSKYSLLGRKCFQDTFKFITQQKLTILDEQPVFQVPITEKIAFSLIVVPQFKATFKSPATLISETQNYPLRTLDSLKVQQEIATNFSRVCVNLWQDSIVKYVRRTVVSNFTGAQKSLLTKDASQINPFIVRLLRSVNQMQASHLFAKFERELRNFLEFLLRFANLSPDFRAQQSYLDYGLDKHAVDNSEVPLLESEINIKIVQQQAQADIRSKVSQQKLQMAKTLTKNPFRIAMRRIKPFHATQIIEAGPSLEEIYKELMKTMNTILIQFTRIPSVLGEIYPYANLGAKTIQVSSDLVDREIKEELTVDDMTTMIESMHETPSILATKEMRSRDQVYALRRQIEFILADLVEKANAQIVELKQYVKYVGMRFEDVLFELKSLIFQNQMDSKMQNEEEDFTAMLDFGADQEHQDKQLMEMIERTEIKEQVYLYRYEELENAYWKVQREVQDYYNFGLIRLDCRHFKRQASEELHRLIEALRNHMLLDFKQKNDQQTAKNKEVWEKVAAEHKDIDKSIEQIDLVNSLQHEEIFEDMKTFVMLLSGKKKFLDQLKVTIPDEDFLKFLKLHGFPWQLRRLLDQKMRILNIEQKKINRQIADHVNSTKKLLRGFTKSFNAFHKISLPTGKEFREGMTEEDAAYRLMILEKMQRDGLPVGDDDLIWDPKLVERLSKQIIELNEQLSKVEDDTKTINRRQESLQLKITDFPELYDLKLKIKPLVQLWDTIAQFNTMIEDWKEKPISKISCEELEDFCNEWYRKLIFVTRNTDLTKNKGPRAFAEFIMQELDHIREFLPLISCLKVKGLDRRHLMAISKEIGETIYLNKLNFRSLTKRELHKGRKFDAIKTITDAASKEYAIRLTIEAVEMEVDQSKLTVCKYKDSFIFKNLLRDMSNFTECALKINSIGHNSSAKFFKERIERLQKELSRITHFYTIWNDLQKYWAYLLPIFAQRDIAHHMPEQYDRFVYIDHTYRTEVANAETRSRTYKQFCKRDTLKENLPLMMSQFEYLMKCLIKYLEQKREYFPRLYFLSNEQIIEIVGMLEDISQLERNLFKMFEGIDRLVIVYEDDEEQVRDHTNGSRMSELSSSLRQRPSNQNVKVWRAQDTRLFQQGLATCLGTRPVRNIGEDLGKILGVLNQDGELLEFTQAVKITSTIEQWLKRVDMSMKFNVSRTFQQAYQSFQKVSFLDWIKLWPTQFLIVILEIEMTHNLDKVFECYARQVANVQGKVYNSPSVKQSSNQAQLFNKQGQRETPMQAFKRTSAEIQDQITQLTVQIREQLPSSMRQRINSLVINRVHCRDVIRNMIKHGIDKSSDFLWKIHMKTIYSEPEFTEAERREVARKQKKRKELNSQEGVKRKSSRYVVMNKRDEQKHRAPMDEEERAAKLEREMTALKQLSDEFYPVKISLRMVEADLGYGYEFLSNSARLVISPLTERCFQSLFLALHYKYGGAPIGPAGTGKTESIKEMGKNLARHCFVFNCQGQIDYQSMSKFFKGLAANGTWVCFDEFNRLEINVLSIISQLIIALSNAKLEESPNIMIEDTVLPFDKSCGLFITMNPFHLGRTPLPDNLQALFRSITMVVPDTLFIAEILLYSVGFSFARNLAFKITRTFALIQEQLKFEKHYDFGLRTVKSVLIYAGELKLRCMKVKTKAIIDAEKSNELLLDHLNNVKRMGSRLGDSRRGARKQSSSTVIQQTLLKSLRQTQDAKTPYAGEKRVSSEIQRVSKLSGFASEEGASAAAANENLDDDNETILEESSIVTTSNFSSSEAASEDESESEDVSSTSEKLRMLIAKDNQPSATQSQAVIEEEVQEETSSQSEAISDQDNNSSVSNSDAVTDLGIDTNYITKELGCESKKVLQDEDLLDQFIVLKAIIDKNLPKLLFKDISILTNIVTDVFPNIPMGQIVNNKNKVLEVIDQRLHKRDLYRGNDFIQNIYNIFEAVHSRHGVMIVGQPTSGKTTSIRILQDVLTTLHQKEYQQKSQLFQKQKALRMGIATKVSKGELVPKDQDVNVLINFALTPHEEQLILNTCIYKGISNYTLNPKSINMAQLMGFFDETSREWTDGVLSHAIRQGCKEVTGKRMLVTCDGPIEPDWVENLNSVLDDNKRLSLITGETIYLTQHMNILLETSRLDECTPATISRCAICYVRRETLPAKAQFNNWLNKLPRILRDQQERLDLFANYFISDIIENFFHAEFLLYPVTVTWAIVTFIRLFESLIFQFRNEKYNDQRCLKKIYQRMAIDAEDAETLRKKQINLKIKRNQIVEKKAKTQRQLALAFRTQTLTEKQINNMSKQLLDSSSSDIKSDLSDVIDEEDSMEASDSSGESLLVERADDEQDPSLRNKKKNSRGFNRGTQDLQEVVTHDKASESQFSKQVTNSRKRVKKNPTMRRQNTDHQTTSKSEQLKEYANKEQKIKPPDHSFVDNDYFFEQSIRNKNLWIDSFFLYSLTWSFGSVLNEQARRHFNTWLHQCVKTKDEERLRIAALEEAKEVENVQKSSSEEKGERTSSSEASPLTDDGSFIPYNATQDFVIGQIDHMEASLPFAANIFDIFFDVQTNKFQNWSSVYSYVCEEKQNDRSKRSLLAIPIQTQDYLRIDFILDRFTEIKKPLLLLGPTAQGKSTLLRNYVNEKDSLLRSVRLDLIGCSIATDGKRLQQMMEGRLVKSSKAMMQPSDDKHQVFFIDDIHMVQRDRWGDQASLELIRQHLDHGGWFNLEKIYFKKVKDINYVTTISTRLQGKEIISERLGWHFGAIGVLNFDGCHIEQIYRQVLQKAFANLSLNEVSVQAPQKLLQASMAFYKTYNEMLKASPTMFLFKINYRHLIYLIKGILDSPGNYFQRFEHLAFMWVNEVCRTILDRQTDPVEHAKLYEETKKIAQSVFLVSSKIFPNDFQANQFFYGQPENENQYNEIIEEKKLTALLNDTIEEYNKHHAQDQISVIVFNSVIEKTLKINRSIQVPMANTILVADQGTGASELCKIAIKLARASDAQLFASDSEQHEDWRGFLRSIVQRVGLETKSRCVIHLIERDFIDGVLDILESLAAHGELFQLFNQEEMELLINQLRYKTFTTSVRGKERTEAQLIEEIREQVHMNLHLLVQLTPRSDVLLSKMRDAPHLLNSSTMIYFGEWSDDGFKFIAVKHLEEKPDEALPLQMKDIQKLSQAMITMYHDTVKAAQLYYQETDHYVYISPQLYELFVQTFKRLFHRRSIKLLKHRDRFRVGLEGIRRTQAFTEAKQEELSKQSPELVEKQRALERLIDDLEIQKGQISKQIQLLLQIEDETVYYLREAEMVQKECEKGMKEATPVFKHAVEGLLQITRREINEIRSIIRPLDTIRTLMTAVCLLLGEEPTIVRNKDTNYHPVKCYWTTAVSHRVLADMNIIHRMTQIDPTKISLQTIEQLEELIETGNITPEKVLKATFATKGIFSWVMAVRNYFFVYKSLEPQRNKLILADLQLAQYRERKAENESRLRELEEQLKDLRDLHVQKEDEVKMFQKEIEEVFILKSKSARLLNELAGEKQKWMVCEEVASQNIKNLEGDNLISAAMVCFLAPFSQKTRDILYSKWLAKIEDHGINITPKLNFNSMFSDPLKVKSWLDNGLPNDSYSIQNAIILKNAQMQPILIDPQTQANKWLRNELNDVKILNMQTSRFLQELKMCIKLGSTVVIENVDETISNKLYPLFVFEKLKMQANRKSSTMQISMDQTVITIDPAFKMYITSVHPNPDFGADISLLANFINFSVTIEAFEAQILALLLAELETEQDAKQRIYRRQALVWIQRLKTIEDEILEELKKPQPQEMLIKREHLIEKLTESRTVTKQTGKTLMEINNAMKILMNTSKLYKPVSLRAAKFFFIVNDIVKLNTMYQFTHDWFISFFSKLVQETMIDDSSKKKKEESIRRLQANFVRLFYSQVCQTLFENDKLLFSFLMAYKELEVEFKIDRRQVEFFIKGALQQEDEIFNVKNLQGNTKNEEELREEFKKGYATVERRKKSVPWISQFQWKAIDKLSQIAPFNQSNLQNNEPNLSAHIEKHEKEWFNYVNGNQMLDYTMENWTTKDEDGNSIHVSDEEVELDEDQEKSKNKDSSSDLAESSDNFANSVSSSFTESKRASVKKDSQSMSLSSSEVSDAHVVKAKGIHSTLKIIKVIKRVNTQRFLDLGIPGGYEKFNYEDAIRQGMAQIQLQQEVKQRIADGLQKIFCNGKSLQKTREEKELDDIFALDGVDSNYTSDDGGVSKTDRIQSRNTDSEEEKESQIEAVEDAFEDFRKNNVEEDTKIALAIIQGIAEYAEFKVRQEKKKTKRQLMKQYVINSHMVRLCIMRCFHPDKLYVEIKSFISYFLGRNFTEPPPFEFNAIYRQTTKFVPILLMLGPNLNPYTELSAFKMTQPATQELPLDYQPLGQIPLEKISKRIIRAACLGNWLLLDNIQLSLEIIANLQKFLESMYQQSRTMKIKQIRAAKVELKELLLKKREMSEQGIVSQEQDSAIALELMLLQQSIIADSQETTFNPIKNNDSWDDQEFSRDEKSYSISIQLQDKLKQILRKRKQEARVEVLKELEEFERLQKKADEESDMREITVEEKLMKELVFPDALAFCIHKKFRLWISVIPVPQFPANFARRCLKISLELPVNIRPNTIKSINSIPPAEIVSVVKNTREFKRMLFSMTVMHAVINHRERFNSFGWTQPYHFSPNDLQISVKMLAELCNKQKLNVFPIKLLRYIVSVLNYGGKLTHQEDQLILDTQVKCFINNRVFDNSNGLHSSYSRAVSMLDEHQMALPYDLTGTQSDPLAPPNKFGDRVFQIEEGTRYRGYLMPAQIADLRSMKEHVRDTFPLNDMAEIFGLHFNATIKANTDYAAAIMQRTYQYQFIIKQPKQPTLTQVQINRKNTMIYEYFRAKLKEILFLVPLPIPPETYEEAIPIEREKPFNTLLNKEIQRYSLLLKKIRANLENTLAAMEGLRQHGRDTENTFECLQQDKTPNEWSIHSYPCHMQLSKFVENLQERINYIKELLGLAAADKFTIRKFWLPGFFNQRNFLTTLMQEVARKQRKSIESLTINFRIMGANERMCSQIKAEGTNSYYVDGLWLYGAEWVEAEDTMVDLPKHQALGNRLPTLHLLIEQQSRANPHSEDADDAMLDCLSTEEYQQALYKNTHYLCPMYVNFSQNRIHNNNSAEGQVITTVPIRVQHRKPKFWIKRNVCILCYNESVKD